MGCQMLTHLHTHPTRHCVLPILGPCEHRKSVTFRIQLVVKCNEGFSWLFHENLMNRAEGEMWSRVYWFFCDRYGILYIWRKSEGCPVISTSPVTYRPTPGPFLNLNSTRVTHVMVNAATEPEYLFTDGIRHHGVVTFKSYGTSVLP